MLMALLYATDDSLVAAARACDQQPLGPRYWTEVHSLAAETPREGETAYVDIEDRALVERLLRMDFADGRDAARAVDDWLFARQTSGHGIPSPHAAFSDRAAAALDGPALDAARLKTPGDAD